MASTSTLDALRKSRLATELSDAQCNALAAQATLRDLSGGEVLVHEGTADNHLYVIIEGVLGVVRNADRPGEMTLFTIGAGDFADELSFIDGTEHYASLIALKAPTRVLGSEREKLEGPARHGAGDRLQGPCGRSSAPCTQIQSRLSMQSVELSNYIYKQHGRY